MISRTSRKTAQSSFPNAPPPPPPPLSRYHSRAELPDAVPGDDGARRRREARFVQPRFRAGAAAAELGGPPRIPFERGLFCVLCVRSKRALGRRALADAPPDVRDLVMARPLALLDDGLLLELPSQRPGRGGAARPESGQPVARHDRLRGGAHPVPDARGLAVHGVDDRTPLRGGLLPLHAFLPGGDEAVRRQHGADAAAEHVGAPVHLRGRVQERRQKRGLVRVPRLSGSVLAALPGVRGAPRGVQVDVRRRLLQDGPRGFPRGPHGRARPRPRRTPERRRPFSKSRGVVPRRELRREAVPRAGPRVPSFRGAPVDRLVHLDCRHGHRRGDASVAGARRRGRRDVRERSGGVALRFEFVRAQSRQLRRRLRRDVLWRPNQGRRAVQSPRISRLGEVVHDSLVQGLVQGLAVEVGDGARTERRAPRRVAGGLPRSGPTARRGRVPRAAHLGPAPLLLLPRLPGLEPARGVAVRAHRALAVVAARRVGEILVSALPRTERRRGRRDAGRRLVSGARFLARASARQGAERAAPGGRGGACTRAHLPRSTRERPQRPPSGSPPSTRRRISPRRKAEPPPSRSVPRGRRRRAAFGGNRRTMSRRTESRPPSRPCPRSRSYARRSRPGKSSWRWKSSTRRRAPSPDDRRRQRARRKLRRTPPPTTKIPRTTPPRAPP